MGDLNAHHPWWGSTSTIDDNQIRSFRTETDSIVDWMETHSFFLHNKPGMLIHFPRNGTSPSVIDLCFSAGNITKDIWAYEINPDSTSDHAISTLCINHTPPASPPKRAWHRADWTLFHQTVTEYGLDLSNIGSAEEALRAATNITGIIHKATDAAVPWVKQRATQAPWWQPDLNKMRQQLHRTERHQRRKSTNNSIQLQAKLIRNQWKTAVQLAKEKYWTTRLQNTDTQSIWKCLRLSNTHCKPLPPLGGIDDFQGKCDILRNALFPPQTEARPPLTPNFVKRQNHPTTHCDTVTTNEINKVIRNLNYASAPRHDRITYELIAKFHSACPSALPHLFDALFRYEAFPDSWKLTRCVVIPKPGKPSYMTPKAYRPISLLPCISKIYERIAANTIAQSATQCLAISPTQMGARSHYSAIDAVLKVLSPISADLSIRKTKEK
jgi:hypothetical protein